MPPPPPNCSTFIVSPENVQHVLKTNFDNYPKGPWLRDMLVDLLGGGIFTSDGEAWFVQRKVAAHMFSVREFKEHIMTTFQAHGVKLQRLLDDVAARGEVVDLFNLYHRFTLDSIAEIAFGVSVGSLDNPDVPFARAFDDAQATVEHRAYLPGWQYLTWLLPREYRLRASIRVMDAYCAELIALRRAEGDLSARHDVLSRFMTMKDEHGVAMYANDDKFLRDVVLNFMIAGRDTTAQALSWATYCLANHPAAAAELRNEVATVCAGGVSAGGGGAAAAAEAAASAAPASAAAAPTEPVGLEYEVVARQLKYTAAAVNETLRLYPSVPKDIKQCVADDVLPDGTAIRAGSYIVYTPHAMGRSKALWGDDAGDFRPERFLGAGEKPSPFKFIAFNAGPRTCLGQHVALVEASYVLAVVFARYNVTLLPGHRVEPADSLTLPMRYGLKATLTRR